MRKEIINEMVKAFVEGDVDLNQFPYSIEKNSLLKEIADMRSKISLKKMNDEDISELRDKLNLSSDDEKTKIIIDIIENYDTTNIKLKEVLIEYKEILNRIRNL